MHKTSFTHCCISVLYNKQVSYTEDLWKKIIVSIRISIIFLRVVLDGQDDKGIEQSGSLTTMRADQGEKMTQNRDSGQSWRVQDVYPIGRQIQGLDKGLLS